MNQHFGYQVARCITREMLHCAKYYNVEIIDIKVTETKLIWFNFTGAANSVAKFKEALRKFPECQNL